MRALQELLRENADELQKFRKMMSAGGGGGGREDDGKKAAAVQERVNKLRASVKEGERALAEAEATSARLAAEAAPPLLPPPPLPPSSLSARRWRRCARS